jgi:hypothetical protein
MQESDELHPAPPHRRTCVQDTCPPAHIHLRMGRRAGHYDNIDHNDDKYADVISNIDKIATKTINK